MCVFLLTALMSPPPGITLCYGWACAFSSVPTWYRLPFKHPQNFSPPKSYSISVISSLVMETFLEPLSIIVTVTIWLKLGCIDSTMTYFGYGSNLHISCCFQWSSQKQKLFPSFFIFKISFATIYHLIDGKMEVHREKWESSQDHSLLHGRDDIWYQEIWCPLFIHQYGILSPLLLLLTPTGLRHYRLDAELME